VPRRGWHCFGPRLKKLDDKTVAVLLYLTDKQISALLPDDFV